LQHTAPRLDYSTGWVCLSWLRWWWPSRHHTRNAPREAHVQLGVAATFWSARRVRPHAAVHACHARRGTKPSVTPQCTDAAAEGGGRGGSLLFAARPQCRQGPLSAVPQASGCSGPVRSSPPAPPSGLRHRIRAQALKIHKSKKNLG
jgi:hypothetical protein